MRHSFDQALTVLSFFGNTLRRSSWCLPAVLVAGCEPTAATTASPWAGLDVTIPTVPIIPYENTCGERTDVVRVPSACPSLEAALEVVDPGGTIRLGPGTYAGAPIVRAVTVVGAGVGQTTIHGTAEDAPALRVTGSGEVVLRALRVVGDAGLLSGESTTAIGAPSGPAATTVRPSLTLEDVALVGGGIGVSGEFSAVVLRGCSAHGARDHVLSLARTGRLVVDGLTAASIGGSVVRLDASTIVAPGELDLRGVTVDGAGDVALLFRALGYPVTVHGLSIARAGGASAVRLESVAGLSRLTEITIDRPTGDGVALAAGSAAELTGLTVTHAAGAGLRAAGSAVTIQDSDLLAGGAAVEIDLDGATASVISRTRLRSAGSDGAIVRSTGGSVTFSDTQSNQNAGRGIRVELRGPASVDIADCVASQNGKPGIQVAGFAAAASGPVRMRDSRMGFNTFAGAIFEGLGDVVVERTRIHSTSNGTCPEAGLSPRGGLGMLVMRSAVHVLCSSIVASESSGLFVAGCDSASASALGTTVTVESSRLACNGLDVQFERIAGAACEGVFLAPPESTACPPESGRPELKLPSVECECVGTSDAHMCFEGEPLRACRVQTAVLEPLKFCPETTCAPACVCKASEVCLSDNSCCAPSCAGRLCGDDGCGGSCGVCTPGDTCTSEGACCTPSCSGKSCGDDGCGGSCGVCPAGAKCGSDGTCCAPSCDGKSCGSDGCGGLCGFCVAGATCSAGKCCLPSCAAKTCGDNGCGGSCGSCASGAVCTSGACCTPACAGKSCGDDGCGGSCGGCPAGEACAADGKCAAASCVGRCGQADEAWPCQCDAVCGEFGGCCPDFGNACGCAPSCGQRECGSDGCGGSCGACGPGLGCGPEGYCGPTSCSGRCGDTDPRAPCRCDTDCARYRDCCDDVGTCGCAPDCQGRECGPDGCGGVCGSCPLGQICGVQGLCAFPSSCAGACGELDPGGGCACDAACLAVGDCCPDFCATCSALTPGVCP